MTRWRLFGCIVLTPILLITLMIGFPATALRLGLAAVNFDHITFQDLNIGLYRTELHGLEIAGPVAQSVGSIQLDYRPIALLGGEIEQVSIDGMTVDVALDRLSLATAEANDAPSFAIPTSHAAVQHLSFTNSVLNMTTEAGRLALPFAGRATAKENHLTFMFAIDDAAFSAVDHRIGFALNLAGRWAYDATPSLDDLEARGELSIEMAGGAFTGLASKADGGGVIQLEMKDGTATATTDRLTLSALPALANTEQQIGRVAISAGRREHPLRLITKLKTGGWRLRLNGPIEAAAAAGQAAAEVDVEFLLDDAGELRTIAASEVNLTLSDVEFDQLDLSSADLNLQIEGVPDDLTGTLAIDLDGLSWSVNDRMMEALTLDQHLKLTFDGRVLTTRTDQPGLISIGQVRSNGLMESGWFTIRLGEQATPLLDLDTQSGLWRQAIQLEIDPVRLETPAGQGWARIEDIALTLKGDLDAIREGRLSIKGARTDWPAHDLALTGIESEIGFIENAAPASAPLPLTIRSIRPLQEDPRAPFSPLRLDATLSPGDDGLRIAGRIEPWAQTASVLRFDGRHQANGDGAVRFDWPDLRFIEGGLQPADLSPLLADVLDDTIGRLALKGEVAWRDGEVTSRADLLIEELGLSIGPARLARVNALFRFDNLAPPTMPNGQDLAIALLDVGLPLTDGLVTLGLGVDGRLAVDRLTWQLAGGEIASAPFSFGSDVETLIMDLDVTRIELAELLDLTELDGLSGEGRIDGRLPLTIDANGVMVRGGKLAATAPGILRYRPSAPPGALQSGGESIGLMLQALENFHYEELDVTLNGRTDGETHIALHIRGANPDLFDAYPIEFNLDLDGDLATLIQTNIANYQIPDRIREKLQGFGE